MVGYTPWSHKRVGHDLATEHITIIKYKQTKPSNKDNVCQVSKKIISLYIDYKEHF